MKHANWALIALVASVLSGQANADIYLFASVYEEVQYTLNHEAGAMQTDFDSGTYEAWGVTMWKNDSYCYYELHNNTRPGDSPATVYRSDAESPSSFMAMTGTAFKSMCWHTTGHYNLAWLWVKYLGTGEWQGVTSDEDFYFEWGF